ncbi:MAG: F0F1 ATP synthase subunit A [Verrucomicrobiota bacterium]|jgi:F-type H+-transporting ATPase subunit a|nr:F0F1 ATP synthase subunit A [Verrucomicrobiota bacterium]
MKFRQLLIAITLIVALPMPALFAAAETSDTSTETSQTRGTEDHADDHGDEGGHHGLPPNAVVLKTFGPFAITNSMVVTWIVAFGLIAVAQIATKRAKLVPSGLQNFVEWLVESLVGFFEGILGEKMAKETFWFFGTIFIFILFTNWFGLIPGIGTVGWDVDSHGHVHKPLLRGVNADLNMTAAMALSFFALWLFWSLKSIGPGGFFLHIFNVKGHGFTLMGIFLLLIYVFVGLVEVVSISVRPVALMFRLYGNVFAGENILETVMALGGPYFGWLAVLPFYFLELLVGLVQALVFALLTAVFTSLMCSHHDEDHAH